MAARRGEDHHHHHRHQQQLHYVSILPPNTNGYRNHHDRFTARRISEQVRPRALYVDFEDAFEDEAMTNDYFGFQPSELNSHPSANFHLQSVETISEVKNNNFSPYIRYQISRETSRPSTPIDVLRYNLPPSYPPISLSHPNLDRDFTNLNLLHSTDEKINSPPPFTPDALLLKLKQQDTIPHASTQLKLTLPQYFLVKYLGRTPCKELWGSKAVRAPIDDTVRNARQLPSMNDIPTLEACVSTHGLTLTHRQSPTRHHHTRNHSPERHQHGLIPLDNISYAMHDVKYSKVASCIVLRQAKSLTNDLKNTNETLTECYTFLFQSKDHAHRFALALAEAFNVQKQPTRSSRAHHDDRREGRSSPPRRSRYRNGRTPTAGKSNDHHFKDSHV